MSGRVADEITQSEEIREMVRKNWGVVVMCFPLLPKFRLIDKYKEYVKKMFFMARTTQLFNNQILQPAPRSARRGLVN
jgi:hypothetical protein